MLIDRIIECLKNREFLSVATSDLSCRPNAAPKFLLKLEDGFIYLIDYTIGRSYTNIKVNPLVSLSFMDTETLNGYQINGDVQIIEDGKVYETIVHDLEKREIDLSTKRIIEGVSSGKKHKNFEVGISERFVILKVKIKEVVEIGPHGEINREKI